MPGTVPGTGLKCIKEKFSKGGEQGPSSQLSMPSNLLDRRNKQQMIIF